MVHGDTLAVPYGIGTFGSRATAVGGTAAYLATQKLKTKLATLAAHLLGAKPSDIVIGRGQLTAKGGKKSIPFGELVLAAYTARKIPPGSSELAVTTLISMTRCLHASRNASRDGAVVSTGWPRN